MSAISCVVEDEKLDERPGTSALSEESVGVGVSAAGVQKPRTSFAAAVLALGGGAVIAQGLGIFTSPILSRLFAPEAFGLAALFLSVSSILGSLGCLRYQEVIMLPRDDKEAANLVGLCIILILATAGLLAAFLGVWGACLTELLNVPQLEPYLMLLPLSVFLVVVALPLQFWNSRQNRFKSLAGIRITHSVSGKGVKIMGGLLGLSRGGHLVLFDLVASAVTPVLLLVQVLKSDLRYILNHISARTMWSVAKRYKRFPMYASWSGLLNTVSRQTPFVLLGVFFGTMSVGYYSLAVTVLLLPMTFVGSAIAEVFFQRAAAKHACGEEVSWLTEGIFRRLVAIGLVPLVMLMAMGPELFGLIFGTKWIESGVYAQILAPWLFVVLVFSPTSVLYNVFERLRAMLLFEILVLGGRVGAILLGGFVFRSAKLTLVLFSAAGVVFYLAQCVFILTIAKVNLKNVILSLARYVLYASTCFALVVILKLYVTRNPFILLCACVLLSATYCLLTIRDDKEIRDKIISIFKDWSRCLLQRTDVKNMW